MEQNEEERKKMEGGKENYKWRDGEEGEKGGMRESEREH